MELSPSEDPDWGRPVTWWDYFNVCFFIVAYIALVFGVLWVKHKEREAEPVVCKQRGDVLHCRIKLLPEDNPHDNALR